MANENVNANLQKRKNLLKKMQSVAAPGASIKSRGGFAPGLGNFNRASAPKGFRTEHAVGLGHPGRGGESHGGLPGGRGGGSGEHVTPGAGLGRHAGPPQPTAVPGTGGTIAGKGLPQPRPSGGGESTPGRPPGDFVGLHGMPKAQLAAFMKAHKGEGRFKRTPHPPPNPARIGAQPHTKEWYAAHGYVYNTTTGKWVPKVGGGSGFDHTITRND